MPTVPPPVLVDGALKVTARPAESFAQAVPVTKPVAVLGVRTVGVPATKVTTAAAPGTAVLVLPPPERPWPIWPSAAAIITHCIGEFTGDCGSQPPSSGANTELIPSALAGRAETVTIAGVSTPGSEDAAATTMVPAPGTAAGAAAGTTAGTVDAGFTCGAASWAITVASAFTVAVRPLPTTGPGPAFVGLTAPGSASSGSCDALPPPADRASSTDADSGAGFTRARRRGSLEGKDSGSEAPIGPRLPAEAVDRCCRDPASDAAPESELPTVFESEDPEGSAAASGAAMMIATPTPRAAASEPTRPTQRPWPEPF